ncbi:YdeI/OmpD-associated family protein [Actinopolymorpha sp. B17G11]|uniref:YdeI/OmpD-associated family protein n=1 Tax=unclassified Actinopolymorpha TaxID=2627063 RepID=UPI0032D8EFC9
MDAHTFQATLDRSEESGTGTFVKVPLDVRAAFGRARPAVRVTIGTHTFRTTVAVYGGEYYVGINRAHREAAGAEVGDTVTVTLVSDDEPRVVELPDDLAAALRSGGVLDHWSRLSYSHQREYVEWIGQAARPETRARRVTQTVQRIGAGLRRR